MQTQLRVEFDSESFLIDILEQIHRKYGWILLVFINFLIKK